MGAISMLKRLKTKLNLFELADALSKVHNKPKEGAKEDSLQVALEAGKKAVLQGSMDLLLVIYELPRYFTVFRNQ